MKNNLTFNKIEEDDVDLCPECDGRGYKDGKRCPLCNGKGAFNISSQKDYDDPQLSD